MNIVDSDESTSWSEQYVETAGARSARAALAEGISLLLITGAGGIGKTTLLRALAREWRGNGDRAIFVSLRSIIDADDLGYALRNGLGDLLPPVEPAVISSSSRRSTEGVTALGDLRDRRILILLDGLDEVSDPRLVIDAARALAEIGAFVVVSSRDSSIRLGAASHVIRLALEPWTAEDIEQLLRRSGVDRASTDAVTMIHRMSHGIPLAAGLLLRFLRESGVGALDVGSIAALQDESMSPIRVLLPRVLREHVARLGVERETLLTALTRVAIRGPIGIPRDELSDRDAELLRSSALVHDNGDVLQIAHAIVAEEIIKLSGLLPPPETRLRDLLFGAEEAERDGLLNASYKEIAGIEDLRSGQKSIVVGDRGAGKSAVFVALTSGDRPQPAGVSMISLEEPADIVLRLESNGEKLASAEQFRAAWLLGIAGSLATGLTVNSNRQKRAAAKLRAALPGVVSSGGLGSRFFAVWNRILRTSIKFRFGPVTLEPPKSAAQTARGGRPIDIAAFLAETACSLRSEGRRAIVAVDRIDEVHKYHRDLQEHLVQGLFLAEASLAKTPEISLLVFIRTDLFETFDIQEKNKLVSRTLRLTWSRDALSRLMVRRICLNPALRGITRLIGERGESPVDDALLALFPSIVEGKPFEEWLWGCLQNGSGHVSPRQFILLLTVLRETPSSSDYVLDAIPIFREDVLRRAMTRVSELSFGEVIDDFRVGRAFLRSCRAARQDTFSLSQVRKLFDTSEGSIALQVDLLERLGVLERLTLVSQQEDRISQFRIPPLYSRCWGTEIAYQ